jgi:hypothetical protein
MKPKVHLSPLGYSLPGAVLTLLAAATPCAPAATVWNGPLITYNQPAPDPTQATNQDRLTSRVWLTRANRLPMFNAAVESAYNYTTSPTDTEWAYGTLANYASLTYQPWPAWVGGGGAGGTPLNMVGQDVVVHLITDDIYLYIKFSYWASFGLGGYTYQRSTPSVVSPTPTVTLTNPAAGAVFAAPANVKIGVNATVSSGSVTNVAFFANTTVLGAARTPPFTFTATNLSAGPYALSAVATASGISATSSVVNVTVVSPVAISSVSPAVVNNHFTFAYSANTGLTYVVQSSSNLFDWVSVLTNVATSNPVTYSDSSIRGGPRFYRVGRLPNP